MNSPAINCTVEGISCVEFPSQDSPTGKECFRLNGHTGALESLGIGSGIQIKIDSQEAETIVLKGIEVRSETVSLLLDCLKKDGVVLIGVRTKNNEANLPDYERFMLDMHMSGIRAGVFEGLMGNNKASTENVCLQSKVETCAIQSGEYDLLEPTKKDLEKLFKLDPPSYAIFFKSDTDEGIIRAYEAFIGKVNDDRAQILESKMDR